MLYDIFIDTLLCGTTGYITNKYVIDMMFKKYSFFNKIKCGDSIVNSKMQFVKSVSTMMEKDIINAQKISEEFFVHNFDKEFESFSKDFFDECICRDIKNLRLKDLPVFYDACCCGKDVFNNILNNNIGSIIQNISDNIDLSSLITQKQAEHISKNIIQNIILTIQNTNVTENIASETFDAFCDVKINEVISKNISNKIKSNIEKEAVKFSTILKQSFDEKIDAACDEILYQIDISGVLKKLQADISQKPIKNIINLSTEDITKKLAKSTTDFINSEKGEKAVTNIYYELIDYILNNNKNISDIYKKDYADIVKTHMKNKANNVAYSVMQWADNNNVELNGIIKESIEEIISGNSDLKSKIFLTINEYYNKKKYNDSSIIKLLLEFTTSGDNLDKITAFIITEIDNYLKSTTTKDIVRILEEKRIIGADILLSNILKFLNENNKSTLNELIDSIISRPVGEIIDMDLAKFFNNKLKYIFIDYMKSNTFYSKEVHVNIAKKVSEYIFDSFDIKINEIIDKEYITDNTNNIKKLIIKDIKKNEEVLTDEINEIINKFTAKNNLADLLDKLSETNQVFDIKTGEKLTKLVDKNFNQFVDDIGDIRISKLLNNISNIPNIHDSLTGFMKNVVGGSIATITEGYISEAVKNHFDDFTDSEFADYIKKMTLTDEKQLAVQGGVIGGALGLSASLASMIIFDSSLIGNIFSWQGAVFCSLVGVSTNFIAVNGFSTAYSGNRLLRKIPLFKNCTDDFIKEKQAVFASYMSEVVEANLIDKETIEDLVQSKSTQIKNSIQNTIADNDYQQIYNCLANNNKYISSNLSALTKNTLNKNNSTISSHIAKTVSNVPIKQIINRNVIDSIMDGVNDNKDAIIDKIFAYISRYLNSDISVLDCMPKELQDSIKEDILLTVDDNFNRNIDFIKSPENIKKYFKKFESSYDSFLNSPLIDVILPDSLEKTQSNLFNNLYDNIFTADKLDKFCEKTYSTLDEQFSVQKCLGDAFSRKSHVFLNGMFYKFFKDIVHNLQNHINLNRHVQIERDIKEKLLHSLNLKEKAAYNSVGGDKALHDIINNLVLIKLPIFFDKNFEQFYEISKAMTNDLFSIKLEDLSVCLDYAKVENLVKKLFLENTGNPVIKNKCFLIFNMYIQGFDTKKLDTIADYFYLESIDDIFTKYNSEISSALKQVCTNAKKSKLSILKEINGVINASSDKIFDSVLIKKLFAKIPKDDLINMKNNFIDIVENNDLIYLSINSLINSFYNYLEDIDLMDTIINTNELKLSLESTIGSFVENDSFDVFFNSLYSQIVSNDLKFSAYMCINKNVKKYFVELLTDGFYNAIKKNLNTIFQSISLDDITKEEILKLPSENYQNIFKIFWKNNLKDTIRTGMAGGIIGMNKYMGLGLTLVESMKNISKKRKEKNNCKD